MRRWRRHLLSVAISVTVAAVILSPVILTALIVVGAVVILVNSV